MDRDPRFTSRFWKILQEAVILRVLVHDVLPVSLSHTRFRPKGVMVIARRGF